MHKEYYVIKFYKKKIKKIEILNKIEKKKKCFHHNVIDECAASMVFVSINISNLYPWK